MKQPENETQTIMEHNKNITSISTEQFENGALKHHETSKK